MRFELTEAAYPADCYVVAVTGELDLSTSGAFGERLLRAVRNGYRAVIADLTDTDFLDSSGLNALLSARKRLASRGGTVGVVATNPAILRTLEITGLDRVFAVSAHLSDALSAAGCEEDAA